MILQQKECGRIFNYNSIDFLEFRIMYQQNHAI